MCTAKEGSLCRVVQAGAQGPSCNAQGKGGSWRQEEGKEAGAAGVSYSSGLGRLQRPAQGWCSLGLMGTLLLLEVQRKPRSWGGILSQSVI